MTRIGTTDPLTALADGLVGPDALDEADLRAARASLARGAKRADLVRLLIGFASDNAEQAARFLHATVRERGTAEDGGPVWAYDHRGRRWSRVDGGCCGYPQRHRTLPFDDVELVDFETAGLPACPQCETSFGCVHHHADDVRIAPGIGPVAA